MKDKQEFPYNKALNRLHFALAGKYEKLLEIFLLKTVHKSIPKHLEKDFHYLVVDYKRHCKALKSAYSEIEWLTVPSGFCMSFPSFNSFAKYSDANLKFVLIELERLSCLIKQIRQEHLSFSTGKHSFTSRLFRGIFSGNALTDIERAILNNMEEDVKKVYLILMRIYKGNFKKHNVLFYTFIHVVGTVLHITNIYLRFLIKLGKKVAELKN